MILYDSLIRKVGSHLETVMNFTIDSLAAAEKTDMLIPITGAAPVHQAPPHNKAEAWNRDSTHNTSWRFFSGQRSKWNQRQKSNGGHSRVMCHCVNTMASTELREAQAQKCRPPRVSANHSLTGQDMCYCYWISTIVLKTTIEISWKSCQKFLNMLEESSFSLSASV